MRDFSLSNDWLLLTRLEGVDRDFGYDRRLISFAKPYRTPRLYKLKARKRKNLLSYVVSTASLLYVEFYSGYLNELHSSAMKDYTSLNTQKERTVINTLVY